ncbi:hypothetical protein GF351_05270 [Candidatus Woesearchaeota archaeon]|nr:hypothetical protein [Candidatus Woesearchaeota archaeon]
MGDIAVVLDSKYKVPSHIKEGAGLYIIDERTGEYRQHKDPKLNIQNGRDLYDYISYNDKLETVDRVILGESFGEGGGLKGADKDVKIILEKEGTHVDQLIDKYRVRTVAKQLKNQASGRYVIKKTQPSEQEQAEEGQEGSYQDDYESRGSSGNEQENPEENVEEESDQETEEQTEQEKEA